MRTAVWIVSPLELAAAALVWLAVLASLANGAEPPPDQGDPAARLAAEREAVWNSPQMRAARAWLEEYFRTSRESPPEVEQAYLARLSQLSAAEMQAWLRQMADRRSLVLRNHQAAADARQWSTTQARLTTQRPAPTAIPRRPASPPNYVQPRAAIGATEAAALRARYTPLQSFRWLYMLDTFDIREDLRALREDAANR